MAEKFEVGAVVVLKSGGPEMTVIALVHDGTYECKWFDGNEVRHDWFPPEALMESEEVPF